MSYIYNYLNNISLQEVILLGILSLAFITEVFYYLYFYTGMFLNNRKNKHNNAPITEYPKVSVIICAKNEEYNLENFLPLVLEQDYEDYEVIVVNDGSWDNSIELLNDLQKKYPHLYHTSIPQDSRVVSHKKLAITVGVKAAKNEILVFTDADCRPMTPYWLKEMSSTFTDETEYVLGYGGYYEKKGILGRIISFDTLFIAMQYFGFAHRGLPYMGVGRNIAYRKSTFIRQKGFAGFLHIPSGDDDLLVNSFGNKHNTRIKCNYESKTLSVPEPTFKDWFHQKSRHLSTVDAYTSKSKTLIGLEPMARGIMYAVALTMLIIGGISPLSFAVLGTVFLIKYIIQLIVINITAKKLKERYVGMNIILLDFALPIITLILMVGRRFISKKKKYKW